MDYRQALQLGYTRSNDPCNLIFLYIRAGKSREDTKMKHVTFKEYKAAKAEILLGVQYKEDSALAGNAIRKTYLITCFAAANRAIYPFASFVM